MALSDDDVREILRLIDDAELDELRIETEGFSLHVVQGRIGSRSRTGRRALGARSGRGDIRGCPGRAPAA